MKIALYASKREQDRARRIRYRDRHGKSINCESSKRRRDKNYEWVWSLKSKTPCSDCGQIYHPSIMEFDHKDPSAKRGMVSGLMNCNLQTIQAEIAKCDIVCSNCHQYRTFVRGHHKRASLISCGLKDESIKHNADQLPLFEPCPA